MEVRPELLKAPSPIFVTLFGILMEVRPEQRENAPEPILVTLLGIMVFLQPKNNVLLAVSIIALQLFRESNVVFPDSTLIEVRPLQPSKAQLPILVTLFGMVTEVRPEQSEKAPFEIFNVPSLIVIDVLSGIIPLYWYAIFLIYTNPSGLLLYQGVSANA